MTLNDYYRNEINEKLDSVEAKIEEVNRLLDEHADNLLLEEMKEALEDATKGN